MVTFDQDCLNKQLQRMLYKLNWPYSLVGSPYALTTAFQIRVDLLKQILDTYPYGSIYYFVKFIYIK